MAFYFFTELDKLNDQSTISNGEAYGPTSAAVGMDRFRVTCTHKVSSDAKVIAVCKGTILVQEQTGTSDLVNIILKPFEQPPFEFPKIKYFIYRGVKKSSLVSDSNIAAKNTNNLTDSLWTDYNNFNNLSDQAPPYQLLGLGKNTAIAPYRNEDLLDNLFYQPDTDHQLPTVQAGWHLANFDSNATFGFEIMFESLGFEPQLGIARKAENIIEVTTLASSPTQAVFFEHWHDKEDILNYLDPCAFWGSFYTKNLLVFNNGDKEKKKEDTLYSAVLSKFKNKNKCYIEIRNEFNFSLNYFKNYGSSATNNTTNIKLGLGICAPSNIDYYTNGWPILIVDGSGFSSTNNHYNEISLQLPCGNGDNPSPLVYLSRAYKAGRKFPETYNLKQKFLPSAVSTNYTDVFKVAVPWISGNLCCSFIKIKHCKRNTTETLPTLIPTQIRRTNYLDALFPLELEFNYTTSIFATKVHFESVYLDLKVINNYDGVFNFGISKEENSVTLFAFPLEYKYTENSKFKTSIDLIGELKAQESTDQFFNRLINIYSNGIWNDINHLNGLNFNNMEWSSIIGIAYNTNNFIQKLPKFVKIVNKQQQLINNVLYNVYDVEVIGYKIDNNNILTHLINTNINVYQLY
ncbi:MAG: hypothetical protein FGM41_07330 [Bacteroidetes bacterium]|nr:hypothetical protein [Bacteroidota bacterium]